jgi:putative addiction module killer protein
VILIRQYATVSGRVVFNSWLESLSDRQVQARIAARLERLAAGNFGDCKPVGGGVSELRIDYGPGYRIYFATIARESVLLLGGGEKSRQSADIAAAIAFLKDYKRRSAKT